MIPLKRVTLGLAASVITLVALGGCMSKGEISDPYSELLGSWRPQSAVLGGDPMPDVVLAGMQLDIEPGKYRVLVAGSKDTGSIELDATHTPKRMRIESVDGPTAGSTFLAIYQFSDGQLQICYDLAGDAYPTQFASPPGTQHYLVIYRRADEAP